MRVIYKYLLTIADEQTVDMPVGARIFWHVFERRG